jgi:hypothetical protein
MKILYIFIYIFIISTFLFSASLSVDELKIIADGYFNKNLQSFMVNTYFKFVASFDGGYKFAANVSFEANVNELQKSYQEDSADYYNKVFMLFEHAEVTARNLLDSHLSLSFWTGTHKYLGEGNTYKGYLYYPESKYVDYKGFYRIRGTGVSTELKFWEDRFRTQFHLYQNTNFVTSETPVAFYYFSFDTEMGLYFEEIPLQNNHFNLKFEIIAGITFPIAPYCQYKVGTTFGVGNDYIDFFISAGLPKIDNNIAETTFDDLYLAADIHFKIFATDHTVSFLTRPLWFNEQKYGIDGEGEKTDIDINYKFKVQVANFPLSGGFVVNFQYSLNDTTDTWCLYLSPFMNISFSGVIWDFAVHYDFSRLYMATPGYYQTYMEGFKLIIGASTRF